MTRPTGLLVEHAERLRPSPAERLRLEGFKVYACRDRDDAIKTLLNNKGQDFVTDLRTVVHAFERQHIRVVLSLTKGNKVKAARRLGIGLSSLYRKLDELNVERNAKSTTQTRQPS